MPLDLSPDQLLRWYLDSGVDEAIGEEPLDRFALSARPAARPAAVPPSDPAFHSASAPARQPHPVVHPGEIPGQADAAHLAGECRSLDDLRRAMEGFDFSWKKFAHSFVFADGSPDAQVMVIGEAPGPEEDRQGLPFIGRSGKLLDRMLASVGLGRDAVYITNVVPWKPPADIRKPGPDEVAVWLPFLTRHIELVDPQLLICFGAASAGALMARHDGIGRLRGRWFEFNSPGLPRPIPAMPTFHPAYLLRTPEAKRLAWRDLLQVRKRLDSRHAG